MKHSLPTALVLGILLSADAQDTNLVADGAVLKQLANEFIFTEGPASDSKGNVFFTDQPNDRIMKWSVDGQLSTFLKPSGRANGLSFDAKGNLWACADEKNELWRISPRAKATVVLKDNGGKLFNGPNDLWLRPGGGLYFTDPYYKRPYWQRGPKEPEWVYYLPPNLKGPRPVATDLKQPNGIIGTPDGSKLYIADIGAGKTFRYRIEKDGNLADKTLFCSLGSDGLTIDERGNVYLTGKGVSVFDPSGVKILQVDVPEKWTANVCFGGKNRDVLFITASKGLYSLQMKVKGVDSQ